jgi:hypothetical protein
MNNSRQLTNRVGGDLAVPVPPHHRTYSAVSGGSWESVSRRKTAKARSGANAAGACDSSNEGSSGSAVAAQAVAKAFQLSFAVATHPSSHCQLLLAFPGSALRDGFAVTTMASADFSPPFSSCCHADSDCRLGRRTFAGGEISQGKLWLLLSAFAGFTFVAYGMTVGHLRPLPDYPATPALYPVSVRRIRGYGSGFLQIPPRGGHPCLRLAVRVITARGGLSPPESTTCLAHK